MKEVIEKQKKVADFVLDKFEFIDPTCIVAGGAPRDWRMGKAASDIDLFFFGRMDINPNVSLKKIGMDEYFTKEKTGEGLPLHYKRNPHLLRVFEFEVDGLIVQAMQMDKPTFYSVLDMFPLSICKAWYKNGRVSLHSDFSLSQKTKSIFFTNNLYNNADGYIKKIKGKFPEYKWYQDKGAALEAYVRSLEG